MSSGTDVPVTSASEVLAWVPTTATRSVPAASSRLVVGVAYKLLLLNEARAPRYERLVHVAANNFGIVDSARLLVAAGADPSLQSSLGADSLKLAQQSIADEALKVEIEVRRPSPHRSSSLDRTHESQPVHSSTHPWLRGGRRRF